MWDSFKRLMAIFLLLNSLYMGSFYFENKNPKFFIHSIVATCLIYFLLYGKEEDE